MFGCAKLRLDITVLFVSIVSCILLTESANLLVLLRCSGVLVVIEDLPNM